MLAHATVELIAALSIWTFRTTKQKFSEKHFKRVGRTWIIPILILTLIPFIAYNISFSEQKNYDSFAQCVADRGVNMYGSFRCGVCAKERALLGDSFAYINEIECHPEGENPQTELCLSREIRQTPTWILEPNGIEEARYVGFMSIEDLATFSGCEAP